MFVHSLEDEAVDDLTMGSLAALTDYLRLQMAGLAREAFRVIHLDGDNGLLADRLMWEGTVDRVQVHAREVVRDVIAVGSTALILAHNHPSGAPRPSVGDIASTRAIARACEPLGVTLHDHVIVSRKGVYSMRSAGLLGDSDHASAARS